MELCEKYYEGDSMTKTAQSVVIDSNLDEEFYDSNNSFSNFGYEGVHDKLCATARGSFQVEVTGPLSDVYVD